MIYVLAPILIFLIIEILLGLSVLYIVLKVKEPGKPVDRKKLFKYTLLWTIMGLILAFLGLK